MSEQSRQDEGTVEQSGREFVDRRRLLASMGAAGAVALAGCSSSTGDGTPTDGAETETDMNVTQETTDDGGESESETDEIGARFGFVATGAEQEPPVEPDHTVSLEIKPRQDRELPEFYFDPAGLYVEPGDTVRFDMASPHHNVNAYHPGFGYTQRVPDDTPPFSSPILTQDDYWLYTFEQEGVHDYMCAPHEIYGMVGRIVVGSATGPGANPVGEAPGGERARSPPGTAATVLSADVMAPETIVEQESVAWSDIPSEAKQVQE
jgi:plastocyanin